MKNINQELINDILEHSKISDKKLYGKIQAFLDLYEKQIKINKKLKKENSFFLEKWDKRNNSEHDKKDKIIEQQSRLAAMGEIIDAVAHQWKQPLNAISMLVDMLEDDFKDGSINNSYITDLSSTVHLQINHMVTTLNEFRNFLRPSTKNENFHVNTIIQNVRILMKDELITQNLYIDLDIEEDIVIFGNENELKHLFINLINNSIDAFNEHDIRERKLSIKCLRKNKQVIIEILDNAGGISPKIIDQIFKSNFTTKAKGKGTGIGLYMSSKIVAKNNGKISVRNIDQGALFTISLLESNI